MYFWNKILSVWIPIPRIVKTWKSGCIYRNKTRRHNRDTLPKYPRRKTPLQRRDTNLERSDHRSKTKYPKLGNCIAFRFDSIVSFDFFLKNLFGFFFEKTRRNKLSRKLHDELDSCTKRERRELLVELLKFHWKTQQKDEKLKHKNREAQIKELKFAAQTKYYTKKQNHLDDRISQRRMVENKVTVVQEEKKKDQQKIGLRKRTLIFDLGSLGRILVSYITQLHVRIATRHIPGAGFTLVGVGVKHSSRMGGFLVGTKYHHLSYCGNLCGRIRICSRGDNRPRGQRIVRTKKKRCNLFFTFFFFRKIATFFLAYAIFATSFLRLFAYYLGPYMFAILNFGVAIDSKKRLAIVFFAVVLTTALGYCS